jgi:hypothetical protein
MYVATILPAKSSFSLPLPAYSSGRQGEALGVSIEELLERKRL